MSRVSTDEHGVVTVALDEKHNDPGEVEVDGDLYDSGPVAIVRFKLSSDCGQLDPLDFGTFAVTVPGTIGATVEGSCILGQEDARTLAAALLHQVRDEDASA